MRAHFAAKEITCDTLVGGIGFGPEYWVDPTRGSNGNSGTSWRAPWKTLEYAESKLQGGINETLYFIDSAATPTGAGSGNTLSAALTWDKSYTHLVGVSPLGGVGNRCRIFGASSLTAASLITVSGTGCIFENISVFYGVASAAAKYAVKITGARNCFRNVRIAGIGNDTQDVADAASLYLSAAEENEFHRCFIGNTTIGRGTAVNSEIFIDGESNRNYFNGCTVLCRADVNTHTFITKNDTANCDWMLFERTKFMNISTNNSVSMLSGITYPDNCYTSIFIMDGCSMFGCADWEVNNRGRVIVFNSPASTAATDGRGFSIV